MTGSAGRPHRDWAAVDHNAPRRFFDVATRVRVDGLAGWINAAPVIADLELMLQAEADREQRMRDAPRRRSGDPGE